MTAFHHYELHCDAVGCPASYNVANPRADGTRADALRHGWVHGVAYNPLTRGPAKSFDFCPTHAFKLAELEPVKSSRGMVNVRDHGAVGDGVTDDRTAVEAAVKEAT